MCQLAHFPDTGVIIIVIKLFNSFFLPKFWAFSLKKLFPGRGYIFIRHVAPNLSLEAILIHGGNKTCFNTCGNWKGLTPLKLACRELSSLSFCASSGVTDHPRRYINNISRSVFGFSSGCRDLVFFWFNYPIFTFFWKGNFLLVNIFQRPGFCVIWRTRLM